MDIYDYKIKDYIKVLSSKESMPGGGSVSALAGAEGMALILMVCNLTIGKEKYKKYDKLIKKTIKDAEKLKNKFLKLMQDDINDFKNIEKVFKMPKNTENEKKKRSIAMEKACKICCKAPKEIIECAYKGIFLSKNIIGKSNMSAASDLVVAAINLEAAAKGAYQNILINFKGIKDKNFIKEYSKLYEFEIKEIDRIIKEI